MINKFDSKACDELMDELMINLMLETWSVAGRKD